MHLQGKVAQGIVTAAGNEARIRDKYQESCFRGERGADLMATLSMAGVDTVVVTGGQHDSCIRETILEGLERGYHIICASPLITGPRVRDQGWHADENLSWYE